MCVFGCFVMNLSDFGLMGKGAAKWKGVFSLRP